MNILLTVIFGFFYLIYKLIQLILYGIWKVIADVARGIYGKIVALMVGMVFLAFTGWIISYIHLDPSHYQLTPPNYGKN